MDNELISHFVSSLSGKYPDVPFNEGVTLEQIQEVDDDPVFLTLPLMKVGDRGKDGLLYTEAFVKRIISEMKSKARYGNMGHVPKSERDSSFPSPKALWVGVMQDSDGTVWGKSYLSDPGFKQTVRQMKVTKAELATSIYGTHNPDKMTFHTDGSYEVDASTFILESVDFAPPERAALRKGHKPVLTTQMENNDMTKEELLAQLKVEDVPENLVNAIIEQFTTEKNSEEVISQLSTENATLKAENESMKSIVAEAAKRTVLSQFEDKLDEVVEKDTPEEALKEMIRGRVVAQITAETKPEELDELIDSVTSTPMYSNLAQIVVAQLSGGKIIAQGGDKGGATKTAGELAEENADSILSRIGVQLN